MVAIPGRRSVASWVAVAMIASGVALAATPAQAAGFPQGDSGYGSNDYSLSYDANSGSGAPASRYATWNSNVTLHNGSGVTRDGYSLDAWTTGKDGSGTRYNPGATIRMPSHGVSLYAHWKVNAYAVRYDANDGTGTEAEQTADFGTQVPLADGASFSRDGYSLVGWASAKDGSGQEFGLGGSLRVPSHHTTLFAHWKANSYAVHYDANDGDGVETDENADFGTTLPLADGGHLSRDGYTLVDWTTGRDGSGSHYGLGDAVRVPSHRIDLYAHWKANTYGVQYDANNGDGAEADQSGDFSTTLPLASGSHVARLGWTLDSWNTRSDGTGSHYGLGEGFRVPSHHTRLYAHWTINRYKVWYEPNQGNGSEGEQSEDYDHQFPIGHGGFTRPCYTQDGWNTESDGHGRTYGTQDSLTMPYGGLRLYAHWTENSYAVTYDNNGGTGTEAPLTRDFDSDVTLSPGAEMSRVGYTLEGWNTDEEGDGTAYALGQTITVPCHHTRLYAQWVANDYTVTYRANGADDGRVPADQTFTVETPTPIVDNTGELVRSGYLFTGWATSADGAVAYTSGQQYGEAQDLTLYAVWLAAPYAVIYHANGATAGNVPEAQDFTVEDPAIIADNTEDLVRTGYRFLGWSTTPDGAVDHAAGDSYATPVTLDLYAVWTALPVVIPPASTTTTYSTSRTVKPLASVPPPAGQTWNLGSMRLVHPVGHALVTRAAVKQGTWTLATATGAVTFAPKPGYVGTVNVGFEVTSSGGLVSSSTVTVVVLPARTLVRSATVYFAPMSAALSPQAKATLRALAASVKKAGKPLSSVTTGYVQAAGTSANDRSLSLARARSVAAYLTALGLPHAKAALGLGKAADKGWKARRATATVTFLIS